MDTDTTTQGVSEREAILERASNARLEELKEEGVELPEEEAAPAPELTGEEDAETTEEEPEEAVEEEAEEQEEVTPEEPTDEEPRKFKVKIDGEEQEVTEDDLVKHYQKQVASERRFEEAANIRKDAEQRLRELEEREAAMKAKENVARQEQEDEDDAGEEIESLFSELTDAVLTEDKKKGIDVIRKLRGKPTPQTTQVQGMDPEEIDRRMELTIARADYKRNLRDAQVKFAGEFKDLDANPILRESVNREASRIHEELGPEEKSRDPWETLKEAGESVRKAIGALQTGDPNKEVIDKKKAGANKSAPPKTVTAKASLDKEVTPEPDRQSVVASMVADRNAALN
jgi:hypothetical protein